MIELGDQIHLWCSFYREISDPHLLSRYEELLNAEELDQRSRFHFAEDRHRYLVTRALIRTVLSSYVALPPAQWTFVSNDHGRPSVGNRGLASELSFNISHTHGLIVIAISRTTVGVDTENYRHRPAPLEIADDYFSHTEAATLLRVPAVSRHYRFFEYWTFKESYIKARGLGLAIPLQQFSFVFDDQE